MQGCTHLQRRHGRYYFRRKVPAELVEAIGRTEIKVSLQTTDPKEARDLARIESLKADRQFAEARQDNDAEPALAGLTQARLELLKQVAIDEKLAELRSKLDSDPLSAYRPAVVEEHPQQTGERIKRTELRGDLLTEQSIWGDVIDDDGSVSEGCINDLLKKARLLPPTEKDDWDAYRGLSPRIISKQYVDFAKAMINLN